MSTRILCPTVIPVMLATLMFVSPTLEAADSVVAVAAAVPTVAIVPTSRFGGASTRYLWPTVAPLIVDT